MRGTAIGGTALDEGLFGHAREVERDTEFPAETEREAEILECQIHREGNVVAAVQDQLSLGLVHEGRAR